MQPKCPIHNRIMGIVKDGDRSFYRCPEYFNREINCKETHPYVKLNKLQILNRRILIRRILNGRNSKKNHPQAVPIAPEKLSKEEQSPEKRKLHEDSKKRRQKGLRGRKLRPRRLHKFSDGSNF